LDVAGLAARVATTALVCTTCGDEDTGLPLLMSLDSGLSADSDAFEAALGSAGESSTAARREEKGRGRCDGVKIFKVAYRLSSVYEPAQLCCAATDIQTCAQRGDTSRVFA
jgi:hypothetical protein